MEDSCKTKQELIEEIYALKQRNRELELQKSEHRLVEDALKRSELKFRTLYDSTSDAVMLLDKKGFLDCNKATLSIFGCSTVEKFCSLHPADLSPDVQPCGTDSATLSGRHITAALENGRHYFEWMHKRADNGKSFFADVLLTTMVLDGKQLLQAVVRDITERKEIEEELRKEKNLRESMIESSPAFFVAINGKGAVRLMNDSMLRTLGYTIDEVTGKNYLSTFVPQSDRKLLSKVFSKLIAKTQSTVNQNRVLAKDGREILVEWHGRFVTKPDGNFDYFFGTGIDITKRKRVEEELRESESRFRELAELLPETVFETDTNGVLIYANRKAFDHFGYTQEDFSAGLKVLDMVIPEDRERASKNIQKIFAGENTGPNEYTILRKNRSTFPSSIHTSIIVRDGKPVGLRGFIVDITDRKQAERNLRLSEIKYRTIVENTNDAIYIHDFEGNIIDVNENACKMVGYDRDELIGAKLAKIDKAWQLPENPDLEQLIERGSTTFERENVRKDGTVIPVEVSVKIVNSEGKGIVQGFVRNITDRKRMEEDLIRACKLESLGVLAGGIAHDFNNLMTVVLGNVQLAMMGLSTQHKSYPPLRAVMQSAEQVKDLTSRLITFSRGGFPVKQISDVSEVLQEVVRKMVKRTGVRVAFDIKKDLYPIAVDENQIRQVFYNLTMNAFEAMPEGGTLTISARNVKISPSDELPLKEGTYLRIIFADNGKGIAEENLVRVFDPYFTTKGMGVNKGVGLGLSVCYSVLRNHDGYIAVTSRTGEGATFNLYIPVLTKKTSKAKTKQTTPSSPKQVLIMEDEIHIRVLERAFLERLGYKVTEAGDGQEAIDRFKEAILLNNPYDLVILDLTVRHGMGGQLTMERMLKEDPSVKAIIASGYVDEPVMECYKDYGFRGALKKPFSFEEFEEMVKKVTGPEV